MGYTAENHSSNTPKQKKVQWKKKKETGAIMSTKTSLQKGHNIKPFMVKVSMQVQIDKDEISNITGPQGIVSCIKDGSFAKKNHYVKNKLLPFFPQGKLEVKYSYYRVKFLLIIKSLYKHTRTLWTTLPVIQKLLPSPN